MLPKLSCSTVINQREPPTRSPKKPVSLYTSWMTRLMCSALSSDCNIVSASQPLHHHMHIVTGVNSLPWARLLCAGSAREVMSAMAASIRTPAAASGMYLLTNDAHRVVHIATSLHSVELQLLAACVKMGMPLYVHVHISVCLPTEAILSA